MTASKTKTTTPYRERTYGYKRKILDKNGSIMEILGEFYQVFCGHGANPQVVLLPVDVDKFNLTWTNLGNQPVSSEWVWKVPLSSVSEKVPTGQTKTQKKSQDKSKSRASLDYILERIKKD